VLNSSTPNPSSSGVRKASPAISPHTPVQGTMPVRGVHGGFDQAQNGRVCGFVEVRHPFVGAVGRPGCTGSNRCADAENFARCASVSAIRQRREFQSSRPMAMFSSKGLPSARSSALHFPRWRWPDSIRPGPKSSVHHLHIAVGAGAKNGAELGAEHFRLRETKRIARQPETDSSPAPVEGARRICRRPGRGCG